MIHMLWNATVKAVSQFIWSYIQKLMQGDETNRPSPVLGNMLCSFPIYDRNIPSIDKGGHFPLMPCFTFQFTR